MDKVQEIREATKWIVPKKFNILWISDDGSKAVSEAWAHHSITYLLSELDAVNAKLLVYQQDNEILEATVTELESKLDASEERMRNRHDSHIVAMWELEQKYKAELDTVKQENERLQHDLAVQTYAANAGAKTAVECFNEYETLQQRLKQAEEALEWVMRDPESVNAQKNADAVLSLIRGEEGEGNIHDTN